MNLTTKEERTRWLEGILCPLCMGKGERLEPSYSDHSKDIMRGCYACQGKGRLAMPSIKMERLINHIEVLLK